jgi:hypothetical protein
MNETQWNAKFIQEAEEMKAIWARLLKSQMLENGVFDYNSIRVSNLQQMIDRSVRTSSLEKPPKYRSLDDFSEIEHE